MKTSIEIVDDINIELMQLNRAHAVADQSNKSYFQGMIDALKQKREDLMRDVADHSDKMSAVLDQIESMRPFIKNI
jgi:hypothetical protein